MSHLDDWRSRATISVPEAGEVLSIGRSAAYNAARRGELPTIRIGHKLLVPTAALDAMLTTSVAR